MPNKIYSPKSKFIYLLTFGSWTLKVVTVNGQKGTLLVQLHDVVFSVKDMLQIQLCIRMRCMTFMFLIIMKMPSFSL